MKEIPLSRKLIYRYRSKQDFQCSKRSGWKETTQWQWTLWDANVRSDYCSCLTTCATVQKKRRGYRFKHACSPLLSGYPLHWEGCTASTTYLLSWKESINILHSVEICSVQGILAGKYLKRGRKTNTINNSSPLISVTLHSIHHF